MLQAERGGLSNAPSKKLGLTDAFYDKRDIVNALGGLRLTPCFRLTPSAQGHTRLSSLPNGTSKAVHLKRVAWTLLSLTLAFSVLF